MAPIKRRIEVEREATTLESKRRCSPIRKHIVEQSENVLWPETEESFFSNSKIEDLLNTEDTPCGPSNNLDFHDSFHYKSTDDSLFSELNLPDSAESNVGGTPITSVLPNTVKWNETLFNEIDLTDLTSKEKEDIFSEVSPIEANCPLQNTQKFLEDVAPKVPESVPAADLSIHDENSFVSKSIIDGIVHGTQYETHEEIQNKTVFGKSMIFKTPVKEVESLSQINWESQIFVEESSFPSKGEFYGLPEKVKNLILENKGIKSLYEWQDECLNLPAIRKRKNLIYALPTSGGKTLVAEILMLREIICREKNVIFVLPYVSIVQEKVSAMSPFAISLDFIVDEYTAGKGKCPPVKRRKRKSIFIASIEKGAVLMDSLIEANRANEIGLIVIDELHLIGERGRGATLEAFLTKAIFLNANIQIVGMSATIGNLSEISAFLKADVYTRGFRPVELKEFIKCGKDILEINTTGKSLEEIFVYHRSVHFNYSDAVARSDPDHLAGLVTECAPDHNCLIFCSSRKNCENVSLLLSRILPKAKFYDHRKKEKDDLMDALEKVCGILSPVLAKTIPFGIAYHHSGLTTDERKFIETAYRFGVLTVICCTSTLAAGVNLPAKRVIIRAPYVGAEFMTLCKYKQMVGRAGRAGLGEAGESILISSSRDNIRVGEMLFSPMDKALSSLDQQDGIGLQGLIMSAIGLGIADCRRDLQRLVKSTLLNVQADQIGLNIEKLVLKIVRDMFKNKVLQIANPNKRQDYSDILTTQDLSGQSLKQNDKRLFIGTSTRFGLTTIGRAAFKSGIDYKRAYAIYNELKLAQQSLLLSNYCHLLYLVISFNSNPNGDELFAADPTILFSVYNQLDEINQKLFKLLGISEAHVAKMGKTNSINGTMGLRFNRLYKVLIISEIIELQPLPVVSAKYNIERGMLQSLISQCTAAASALVRLCEEMEELWCFRPLFERVSRKLDHCGTIELEPLLDLPAVKINRAKQLYTAGYKTIEDIAKCRPIELVKSIEHMPMKIAKEIVSAAKIMIMKKLDNLEEETENLKMCLNHNPETQ